MEWVRPISLHGEKVSIVPLEPGHLEGLQKASADGELYRLWYTLVPAPEKVAADIEHRLRQRQAGSMLPFTVVERTTDQIAGMTTYLNIDAGNKRLEIGGTWYRQSVQRTGVNTECNSNTLLKNLPAMPWSFGRTMKVSLGPVTASG
jgi:RimJ/RimL family protein N-acetyltransferase